MKDEQVFITYQHRELPQSLRWARFVGHPSVYCQSDEEDVSVRSPTRIRIAVLKLEWTVLQGVIETV